MGIRDQLVQEAVISNEYISNIQSLESLNMQNEKERDKLKTKVKSDKLQSTRGNYDIVFTLINPQPDKFDSKVVVWNIQEPISKYFVPFLDTFANVAKFKVASQVVYRVKLGANPKRGDKNGWILDEEDIPRLITPVERKIGF